MRKARILIVDDDTAQMNALANTVRDQGYDTEGFTSAAAALETLTRERFELLLADLIMPEMDGIALLRAAQQIDRDLVGVIMTGEGTIATAVEAMQTGALDYILKPFKLSAILPVISRALSVRDLRLEVAALERSVRERTVELETANKELEAFAYSVSHDLRSPLTAIIGSVETLIDVYGPTLPDQGRAVLDTTLQGALQMTQLIDDLLRLSRVGREKLSKQPVDIATIVRDAVDELGRNFEQRHVEVRLGELPEAVGDPALLRQVFVNLLSNAYKFTRGKDPATIEVGSRIEGAEQVYFVRDNGAGFDMRNASELFAAFHRLHSSDQFEGTGVGLSIAHRVVTRHGGRIWADAQLGSGATFYFSLPGAAAVEEVVRAVRI